MEANSSEFKAADAFAAHYDESAEKYCWYAPEVLFGLVFYRLESGQSLLDLGIGTGLSAAPFKKAGLQVHGVDGSKAMLRHCESRGVAIDLKQHDIRTAPLPYADDYFDHIVACGVFHLIAHLDDIFAEAARVIREAGTFVFTTEELRPDRSDNGLAAESGVLEVRNEKSGILSCLHSHNLIETLLRNNNFTLNKTLDFVAYRKTDWADERTFRAYVAVRDDVRYQSDREPAR